jgi:hypothetical protein
MSGHLAVTSNATYPSITYVANDAVVTNVSLTIWESQIRQWVSAANVHRSDRGPVPTVILRGRRQVRAFSMSSWLGL